MDFLPADLKRDRIHQSRAYISPPAMSWRNQGITGSNNIPLGTRRRFGGEPDGIEIKHEDSRDDGLDSAFNGDRDLKRGRSPEPSKYPSQLCTAFYLVLLVITDACI